MVVVRRCSVWDYTMDDAEALCREQCVQHFERISAKIDEQICGAFAGEGEDIVAHESCGEYFASKKKEERNNETL